jgi:hypothetical protein
VEIGAAEGTYDEAPSSRSYQIIYHGLSSEASLYLNDTPISTYSNAGDIPANQDGAVWDSGKNLLNVYVSSRGVDSAFRISSEADVP